MDRWTCELNQIKNKVIQSAISDENKVLFTNGDINHCSFVYGNPGINCRIKLNSASLDYLYGIEKRVK